MRRLVLLGLALALALLCAAPAHAQSPVTFDQFSMKISGKRVFLNGGEAKRR